MKKILKIIGKLSIFLTSFLFISQVLTSCRAEGDIHSELENIYTTVEASDDFELEMVFDGYVEDIEILGAYLFASYPIYELDDDSTPFLSSAQCHILKDGESHYNFSFDKELTYKPFQLDEEKNVYIGNTVIYPPNYDRHEVLPTIDPEQKEASLKLLKEIVPTDELQFRKEHFNLLEDVDNYNNEDSLKNELLYAYRNDISQIDSAYREYLFFFLYNASSYVWSKSYTIVNYKGQTFFWNSYKENDGRYKLFRKKIFTLDKSNNRTFGADTDSFFGKLKYNNPAQEIKVNLFDKVIEKWETDGFGAPHAGLGIIFPNPSKIWYYEVLKADKSVLKFKVRENEGDILEPFNYLTSKDEFYLYGLHSGKFLRVRL